MAIPFNLLRESEGVEHTLAVIGDLSSDGLA
jgi:hypothetical protein